MHCVHILFTGTSVQFSSVAQSCPTLCDPMNRSSLSITNSWSLPKVMSIESVMPSSHLICHSLLFLPPIPSSIRVFSNESTLQQVTKGLELQLQHQSLQLIFRTDFLYDWLVWSPCCPRDSQESSLAPQFKSINSLALSLLYGPTLTSIQDYWKNHSYTDLCRQSNVSPF